MMFLDTSTQPNQLSSAGDARPVAATTRSTSVRGLTVTALLMTVMLMIGTGIMYPLVMTGIVQIAFNGQANGSLMRNARGQVIGSSLIGQSFTKPGYFHPRPSAAGKGYDATASGGSNLGPTNKTLIRSVVARAAVIRRENRLPPPHPLPADAVTASASGLDPDISPAYAAVQVPRVARARHMTTATLRALVRRYTSGRTFGLLGEPRVNVLELNLALDRLRT